MNNQHASTKENYISYYHLPAKCVQATLATEGSRYGTLQIAFSLPANARILAACEGAHGPQFIVTSNWYKTEALTAYRGRIFFAASSSHLPNTPGKDWQCVGCFQQFGVWVSVYLALTGAA